MSDMIERVTDLLWKEFATPPRAGEDLEAKCRRAARAAIEAMREPSEAMVAAGNEDSGIDGHVNAFWPIVPWQAMIDNALAPSEAL